MRRASILALVTVGLQVGTAQAAGELDTSFAAAADRTVRAVAVQPDGKILLGGDFTAINGQKSTGLARLNVDGTLDASFAASNLDRNLGPVRIFSLALQPDGKILLGGNFVEVDGQPRTGVVRLNANGTIDGSFLPPNIDEINYGRSIFSLAVQKDGKILVGGDFVDVGGQPHVGVARLNPDGSLDNSFNPGLDDAANLFVEQPGGAILIGGPFLSAGGESRVGLARLRTNGSLDGGFNLRLAEPFATSIAVQRDGKILIGGDLAPAGKQLVRLNADGSIDKTFSDPGIAATDGGDTIQSIIPQYDGRILIGGAFVQVGAQDRVDGADFRHNVARLSSNGALDKSFVDPNILGTDADDGLLQAVRSMALQPDGKVIVAGDFNRVNGVARNNVARLLGSPPTVRVSRMRVKVTGTGASITSRVEFSGGGVVAQRASSVTKKPVTYCEVSTTAPAAGVQNLKCDLGPKVRRALRKKSLKLKLLTSFTPTAGKTVTSSKTLTIKRRR